MEKKADDKSHRTTKEELSLYNGELTAATYYNSFLYISTPEDEIIRLPIEKLGKNGLVIQKPLKTPLKFKTNPSDQKITHIAVGKNNIYAIARKDGTVEVYKRGKNFTLEKVSEISIAQNGSNNDILDLKFANGDLIIARSKSVSLLTKNEIDEMLSTSKKSDDSAGIKELRKRHSAKTASQFKYEDAKTHQYMSGKILAANNELFICDKAEYEDGKVLYFPLLISEKTARLSPSPDETTSNFLPFMTQDLRRFFVRNGDDIEILDTNRNVIKSISCPPKNNNGLSIFSLLTNDPNINDTSLIEIDGTTVRFINRELESMTKYDDLPIGKVKSCAYNSSKGLLFIIHQNNETTNFTMVNCGSKQTKQPYRTIENTQQFSSVTHFAVSQHNYYLVAAEKDETVKIYNLQHDPFEFKELSNIPVKGNVLDLRIDGTDNDLLIATDDINEPLVRISNFKEQFDPEKRADFAA